MQSPKQIAAKIAESYDVSRWLKGYIRGKLGSDPVFNAGLEALNGREGLVIDLGCGLGLFGLWLRAHGCELPYTGCDLGGWKIAAGNAAAERLGFKAISLHDADMTAFPLDGASVICAFDVLHYLPAEVQERFVQKLAEAAAGGALLLVRTGVRGCGWRSAITLLEEFWTRLSGWIRGGQVNFPVLPQLVAKFEKAGCKVEVRPLWGKTPFSSYWLKIEAL